MKRPATSRISPSRGTRLGTPPTTHRDARRRSPAISSRRLADPDRYAALSHPGDSYSYDMFSQAGQAVRDSASTVLGGLRPHKVLGIGESRSAFRLTKEIL
ncbi:MULTISPECIES: alpha/beta hydrolase domain-containing protein [Streptomyces]|uniref:Alpha/beta hydrolase domain-containing protein n=2 Tax=Streptomyces TaxID=1883 RepID=A0ABV9IGX4_9ACTN